MRQHPHLYEINALVYLRRLSRKYDRPLTLSTIPEAEWRRLADLGFDMVWFMGVWRRSQASRQEALAIPGLRLEYSRALGDWSEEDVIGSPYAIYDYTLEPALGEEGELDTLKASLNRAGLGLMLDFVPNHVARDHSWTRAHPDWFITADRESISLHPDWFYPAGGDVHLAHGKDPYFSPWTDTAQLNFHSAGMREALTEELLRIARVADGVRCDMSMLVLNGVFRQTWGWALKDSEGPQTEFWQDAISRVKNRRSDFVFLGEAYWGLERELQHLGFDFTYDKPLYDMLAASRPDGIRERLAMEEPYQGRMARFIENHDEPRAVAALGVERSRAAAVVLATIPGLRLFHDGQLEGRQARLPVQLGREPEEAPDTSLAQFYQQLLRTCGGHFYHEGNWKALEVEAAYEGDESYRNLLAWAWEYGVQARAVVVNYSPDASRGRVKVHVSSPGSARVELVDELSGERYTGDAREMSETGLYVDLAPWGTRILAEKR